MIHIHCECGGRLKLPNTYIGKLVSCPGCRKHIRTVAPHYQPDHRGFDAGLVVIRGPRRVGEQILLGGENPVEIGKMEGRHIRLRSNAVSRLHCRLLRSDYGWRIEDQNSTNGLRINGRKKKAHNLLEGDRIRIGDFTLQYFLAKAQPSEGPEVTPDEAPETAAPPPPPIPGASKEPAAAATAVPVPDNEDALTFLEDEALLSMTSTAADASPYDSMENDAPPESELQFAEEDFQPPPPVSTPVESTTAKDRPTCPSCGKILPAKAKICVDCGVDVKSGRSLVTAHERNLDSVYTTVEGLVRVLSWFIWIGIYPVASEAFGIFKPHAIRVIALLTIGISIWYSSLEWTGSQKLREHKNLMLWAGDGPLDADRVESYYYFTDWGDEDAFASAYQKLKTKNQELEPRKRLSHQDLVLDAHRSLSPEQQCIGQYHTYQMITYAFLHGGIMHLLGNLLFLMVFGTRVNALIGNVATCIVYPILAIGGAFAHIASMEGMSPEPMLGASGAIMGLAGMYIVLFPVHRVHMVAWARWGILAGFHLSASIFTVRGFWVVLFYIAFDVVYTYFRIEDGVAHWAHLGGFIVGVATALFLLFTRLVNARGGDILSVILGRRAWALVGRPTRN